MYGPPRLILKELEVIVSIAPAMVKCFTDSIYIRAQRAASFIMIWRCVQVLENMVR